MVKKILSKTSRTYCVQKNPKKLDKNLKATYFLFSDSTTGIGIDDFPVLLRIIGTSLSLASYEM